MEKLTYNKDDVRHMLGWFERTYGMPSEEFYVAHTSGAEFPVPRFHRHVWASFWRESQRVGFVSPEFVTRAEATLAFAV